MFVASISVGKRRPRLHYVLWFLITDGLGSTLDLTGPFDRVQIFKVFVPYLLSPKAYLRRCRRRRRPAAASKV